MTLFPGVDLGDAASRNRRAFTNELKARRDHAVANGRFRASDGYVFRGGADLVLKHGHYSPGRYLPSEWDHVRGEPNCCYSNALAAVQADPRLRYCEGYYHCGKGVPVSHGWLIGPDGKVVDATHPANFPELAGRCADGETGYPYLPPERWAYYGVTFATALVLEHDQTHGLPILDRSQREITDNLRDGEPWDMSEIHDFPLLKVAYDPNRQELP